MLRLRRKILIPGKLHVCGLGEDLSRKSPRKLWALQKKSWQPQKKKKNKHSKRTRMSSQQRQQEQLLARNYLRTVKQHRGDNWATVHTAVGLSKGQLDYFLYGQNVSAQLHRRRMRQFWKRYLNA